MMFKVLAAFAVLALPAVLGECPDSCSGHGECSVNDKCTCYKNWQGGNCAQRTCAFARSWSDPDHAYTECASVGSCDRATGLCDCLDGFTGQGCDRLSCPEDCSGHGTCESIAELASDTSAAAGGKAYNSYSTAWDATKSRGCKCDPGFTGMDCSGRMCPRGDDPLTLNVDKTHIKTTSLEGREVQNVTAQSSTQQMNGGQVTFTYTDLYNAEWTTRPVDLPAVQTVHNKNNKIFSGAFEWTPVAYEFNTVLDGTNLLTGDTSSLALASVTGGTSERAVADVVTALTGSAAYHVKAEAADGPGGNYVDTACDLPLGLMTVTTVSAATNVMNLNTVKQGNAAITDITGTCNAGHLKLKFMLTVSAYSTTTEYISDVVTGQKIAVRKATLKGFVSTEAAASQLRRGDKVMFAQYDGGEACIATIAKDVVPAANAGTDTYLYVDADNGAECNSLTTVTPVSVTTEDTAIFVYSQWKQTYIANDEPLTNNDNKRQEFTQASGTGSTSSEAKITSLTKTSSSFYTLNAQLGTAAGAADKFGRELLPGTWLRVYDPAAVGSFCDLQVKEQPDSAGIDQTIKVMPVATTTYNYGYNYGGLDGCATIEKTYGNYAMAVLYPYMQAEGNSGAYYYPGDASTVTFAADNNVVTRSVAFGTEDIETLIPGAIVAFSSTASTHGFACVAQVAAMPTSGSTTFTYTAPPSKWTASTGYGLTSCTSSTMSAAVRTMFVYGAASALYFNADDDLNPNKFSNFAAGDWVTITGAGANHGSSSEASVTVQVETATTSSLIFSMGSMPNGAGMHAGLPSRSRVTNKLPRLTAYPATGPSVHHVPTTGNGRGEPAQALVVQMYSSTSGATTDAAATDSAAAVARVLTELPNQAVPEISVAMTSNALSLYAYTVTFTHAGNSGNQHSIVMNTNGCNVDGCQPRYDGVRTQHLVTATGIEVTASGITGTDIAVGLSSMTTTGGDLVTLYGQNVVPGERLKTSGVATTTATVIGTATAASSGIVTLVVAKSSADGSGVSDWTTGEGVKSATYEITRGTYEATECSSRGTCDRDSGMCECAPGYTGSACATQTIIM